MPLVPFRVGYKLSLYVLFNLSEPESLLEERNEKLCVKALSESLEHVSANLRVVLDETPTMLDAPRCLRCMIAV